MTLNIENVDRIYFWHHHGGAFKRSHINLEDDSTHHTDIHHRSTKK